MKGKKNWKRWLCMALTAVLLVTLPGTVSGAQDETAVQWTYENSILITVQEKEEKNFTSADFSEINCCSVCVVGKSVTEKGILYELILVLKNGNAEETDKAIRILSQSEKVKKRHSGMKDLLRQNLKFL